MSAKRPVEMAVVVLLVQQHLEAAAEALARLFAQLGELAVDLLQFVLGPGAAGQFPEAAAAAEQALPFLLAEELERGAGLAREAQAHEPLDLALALDAGGMVGRQRRDQLGDAVAQLQGEVRGGGAHQLADVLHGHLVVGAGAVGMLEFAHEEGPVTGEISSRASIRDWASRSIARSSPMSQP